MKLRLDGAGFSPSHLSPGSCPPVIEKGDQEAVAVLHQLNVDWDEVTGVVAYRYASVVASNLADSGTASSGLGRRTFLGSVDVEDVPKCNEASLERSNVLPW